MAKSGKKVKPTLAALRACKSVGAVIRLLKRAGCKGNQWLPTSCPLAHYIKRVVKTPVSVSGKVFRYHRRGTEVPLTDVTNRFVSRFDDGLIPELIA